MIINGTMLVVLLATLASLFGCTSRVLHGHVLS
jgi:hypothetical protein